MKNHPRDYDLYSEWPFLDDQEKIRVFHPKGNIAIVIGRVKGDPPLASILAELPGDFPLDHVAIIGTVWTLKHGIERIVINLITNPFIDTLILCGRDSKVFFPLRGLICLEKWGVDEERHVLVEEDALVRDMRKAASVTLPECHRVFARDALATLSHSDIEFFQQKHLNIVDLIDNSTDIQEIFQELTPLVRKLARIVENPSFDFLDKLNIYAWKEGRTVVAREKVAIPENPYGEFRIERDSEASKLRLVWYDKDCTAPRIAICAQPCTMQSTQAIVDTAMREKLFDYFPSIEHYIAYISRILERAVLEMRYPKMYSKLREKYEDYNLPNNPPESPFPKGGLSGDISDPTIEELPARRSKILRDPEGYFRLGVSYEENIVYAEYLSIKSEASVSVTKREVTIQSESPENLLTAIIEGNYISDYQRKRYEKGRYQHIAYLAVQLERAFFALRSGIGYEQDRLPKPKTVINIDHHVNPAVLIEAATLEEAWVKGLTSLRREGLLTTTAEKGRVAENWATVFHIANMSQIAVPRLYSATEEDIKMYVEELFREKPGSSVDEYTYGDRQCYHFYDQIASLVEKLGGDPTRAFVSQRWDPDFDWETTHAPCLVFDTWFIQNGRLNTFQVVRSHDIYGGMPLNVLGVSKGWASRIAGALKVELGDLIFLSISNNYRVGDNSTDVRKVISCGIGEKSDFTPNISPIFIRTADTVKEAATLLREYTLTIPECSVATPVATKGKHIVGILMRGIDDTESLLDFRLVEETLSGRNPVGKRLTNYHSRNQISLAISRLRKSIDEDRRTDRVVLTPRDPMLDREKECSDLLMIQLRYQLGALHAAGVFFNSRITDFPRHISSTYGIQKYVAEAIQADIGTTYIQYAPLLL